MIGWRHAFIWGSSWEFLLLTTFLSIQVCILHIWRKADGRVHRVDLFLQRDSLQSAWSSLLQFIEFQSKPRECFATAHTGRFVEEGDDCPVNDLILLEMVEFALQRADRNLPRKFSTYVAVKEVTFLQTL